MSSREVSSGFFKKVFMTLMLVILFSSLALAQEDQAAANAVAIDTIWTLIAAN